MGNKDVIGPGDVQWMTAAHGVVHEEYHSTNFAKVGGVMEMYQIWVNLPANQKLSPPKYQPLLKNSIPIVTLDDNAGSVRVISGSLNGVDGVAETFSPINVWDVTIEANKTVELQTIDGYNTIVFCRTGSVKVGNSSVLLKSTQMCLLSSDGDGIKLETLGEGANIMILDGKPLDEPIAARGPFVMNTEKELGQANIDYQNGLMG